MSNDFKNQKTTKNILFLILTVIMVISYNCSFAQDSTEIKISELEKAIEANPKNCTAFNRLGIMYHEMGDYEAAVVNYQKSIEYAPKEAITYYNLGLVYNKLEQFENAIDAYLHAIQIDPDDSNYYTELACTYDNLEQSEQAMRALQKALDIDPNNAYAYRSLGYIAKKIGMQYPCKPLRGKGGYVQMIISNWKDTRKPSQKIYIEQVVLRAYDITALRRS